MSGKSAENYAGATEKFHVEEYHKTWKIPHWKKVQRSVDKLKAQSFEFKTGRSTLCQTKWLTGFKMCNPPTKFRVYWKMIEEKGFPDGKVDAIATSMLYYLCNAEFIVIHTDTQKMVLGKDDEIEFPYGLPVNSTVYGPLLSQKGNLLD